MSHLIQRLEPGEPPVLPNSEFSELALSGTLYDYLHVKVLKFLHDDIEHMGGDSTVLPDDLVDIEWIKERFMSDILTMDAGGTGYSLVEDIMQHHFPDVVEFCECANAEGVGNLVAALECLEAMLVIHGVVPLLQGAGVPCLSAHGTIWAKRSDVGKVKEAFEEVFDDCGFRVPLKTEG